MVDLLPDRTAESLAAWLRDHPGVEIITRDRSTTYAEGARQGALAAVQVADRWHLLKNLVDTVENALARHKPHLRHTVPLPRSCPEPEGIIAVCEPPPTPITYAERTRLKHRAERLQRYQHVMALHERGLKLSEIAHKVGISERTVNRFLAAGTYPERKRRSSTKPGLLVGHTCYLDQRWAEGCANGIQLWRELCGQGFAGSKSLVLNYFASLRHGGTRPSHPSIRPATPPQEAVMLRYTPRQAAVLFVRRPEEVNETEVEDIAGMVSASAEIAAVCKLARRFAQMIRQRRPEALEPWLESAQSTTVTEFRQFAASLSLDKAAVAAALQYPWSSGQAEGQTGALRARLKLIKRTMYGRANFDLLRQRVLAA